MSKQTTSDGRTAAGEPKQEPVHLAAPLHYVGTLQGLTEAELKDRQTFDAMLADPPTRAALWRSIETALLRQGAILEVRARRAADAERVLAELKESQRREMVAAAQRAFRDADTATVQDAVGFYQSAPLNWSLVALAPGVHHEDRGDWPVSRPVKGLRKYMAGPGIDDMAEHFGKPGNDGHRLAVDLHASKVIVLAGDHADLDTLAEHFKLPVTLAWTLDGRAHRVFRSFPGGYSGHLFKSVEIEADGAAILPPTVGTDWTVPPAQFAETMGDNQTGLPDLPPDFVTLLRELENTPSRERFLRVMIEGAADKV